MRFSFVEIIDLGTQNGIKSNILFNPALPSSASAAAEIAEPVPKSGVVRQLGHLQHSKADWHIAFIYIVFNRLKVSVVLTKSHTVSKEVFFFLFPPMANSPAQSRSNGPVTSLRAELAKDDNIVVGPGVYDGITARIALKSGFDCLYMVIPYASFILQRLLTTLISDRCRYNHV